MTFKKTKEYIEELKHVVEKSKKKHALKMMEDLHPADIAEIYDELNIDEAKFLFLLLDGDRASDVLAELEEDGRKRFLKVLPSHVVAKHFIENMDSDDAADVLGEMTEERQQEVLSYIEDEEQASDIIDLLKYDEDTAGGIMAKELIQVNENWTITRCLKEISLQSEDIDEIYNVYVVDDKKIFKGVLSLKEMIVNPTSTKVSKILEQYPDVVKTGASTIAVANMMNKYDLIAVPVVNKKGRLVGRITIDDIVDIIREEAERDYQLISGITEDVEAKDNVFLHTRARLPWLLIGLIGGILGAIVIENYEYELGINPAMAFFIPLIAAMGGNVGVQSSAIVVQGLANKTISIKNIPKKVIRELQGSLLIAVICSGLIFLFNFLFFSESYTLTISVSTALFLVIIGASVSGTLIPLLLEKFKIDPALATGPFITTVNDILGLILYLYIGKMFFDYFS